MGIVTELSFDDEYDHPKVIAHRSACTYELTEEILTEINTRMSEFIDIVTTPYDTSLYSPPEDKSLTKKSKLS